MKGNVLASLLLITAMGCTAEEPTLEPISIYPLEPVGLKQIEVTDQFWANRIQTVQQVTIPHLRRQLDILGRIDNFDKAAGVKEGEFIGVFPFDDTDVYKTIEAVSYSLMHQYDPELDAYLDQVIARIAAAQAEDGYLMTWRQIDPTKPPNDWSGDEERWSNVRDGHELYNSGHLYEAAAAHYQATGKRNLLDVALKNAELVQDVFNPGKNEQPPGHEVIEMGLVQLYAVTGDEKLLDLAQFFLSARGQGGRHDAGSEQIRENGKYWQDHAPVTEQREAVGHAVRAGYLYSGMADFVAVRQREDFLPALEAIWTDIVTRKQHLTGGVGAQRSGESFDQPYVLPNADAYNESCAAIANVLWNHRMFLISGESKYLDVLERTLYNGAISGLSLKGDSFFYCNPLSAGIEESWNTVRVRPPWQRCACCPPNLARFILSMPRYIAASKDDSIYLNLFVDSKANLDLNGVMTEIVQETKYPWDGKVSVTVSPDTKTRFSVVLRVPGWARNRPVPSDLYTYLTSDSGAIFVRLNGADYDTEVVDGFIRIDREWERGDQIELNLPMPVRRVLCHENVEANRGRVALERGPLVYCAESADQSPRGLALSDATEFTTEYRSGLLNGVVVIQGEAFGAETPQQPEPFQAIPYFAWANRGEGEMAVWLPRLETP